LKYGRKEKKKNSAILSRDEPTCFKSSKGMKFFEVVGREGRKLSEEEIPYFLLWGKRRPALGRGDKGKYRTAKKGLAGWRNSLLKGA